MARWSATQSNWTPTAVADTTAFTNSGYFALQGGTTTQVIKIWEVKMGGLAGASAPAQLVLARDSTVGASSLSGGTLAAHDPATANLGTNMIQFSTSTTKPQRSSTLYLLDLSFNAFGGLIRLQLPPEGPIGMLGNTASLGEVSISHLTNGTPGLCGCNIIFEPV